MNRIAGTVITALLAVCVSACAQMPPGPPEGNMGQGMGMPMAPNPGGMKNPAPPRQGGDPMVENFFPPELIMQNQKALGLKEDQQTAIRAEMQKTMARFTDLQWQQSAETETMADLVKQERPDEKKILAALDKLLAIEAEIKRLHLGMLIRIKNLLTPDQQAELKKLKSAMAPHPGMGGPQGPGMRPQGGEGPRSQVHPPAPLPREAPQPPPER
jgi:Spy/CpxP family protein refolding chaperone